MDENNNATLQDRNELLADNQYVKELYSILQNRHKNTDGLSALLNHVAAMESFVKHAENRIAEMKGQLDEIKEIQNHPLKSALQNIIRTLEKMVADIKQRIIALKNQIVEGCHAAVDAFKANGIKALDKVASYLDVKDDLSDIGKVIDDVIKIDEKAIAKIDTFAKEYHSAGRAFRNMARVIVGKEPISKAKESGMLAMAISAPFKTQKFIMTKMRESVNKAVNGLERLSAKAWEKRESHKADKKPSITERLQTNLSVVEEAKREHRLQERVAVKGAEI